MIYYILGYSLITISIMEFVLAAWTLTRRKKLKTLSWHVAIVFSITGAYAMFAGLSYLRAQAGLDFSFYYRMCWVGFASAPGIINIVLDLNGSHAKWKRYITRSLYLVWAFVIYLCATTELIDVAPAVLIPYTEVKAPFETIARLFAAAQIVYIIYEAIRARKRAKGLNKSRVGYIALGLSLYAASAFITSILVQVITSLPIDPALTSLFSILFAIPVAYAITRQRLFDLRILIARLALSVVTTLVFFLIHFAAFSTFSTTASTNLTALALAALVVSLVAFVTPLYTWIGSLLSATLGGPRISHGQLLGAFNELIVNSPNLDEVLRKTGQSLRNGLGASTYAILLKEDNGFKLRIFESLVDKKISPQVMKGINLTSEQMACLKQNDRDVLVREEAFIESIDGVELAPQAHVFSALDTLSTFELIVPLACKGELVGVLCLGSRNDAVAFTTEDLQLVSTLGTQLALYIENARLFNEAVEDGLTGLFHQKYFKARLSSEVSRLKRHRSPMAILLMDIDHFKMINDHHGHVTGDHVLATMGTILRSAFRTEDVVARYGGEEFAVLLIEPEVSQILPIAERIRQRIEGHQFSEKFDVTVSVGVYVSTPEDILSNLPIAALVDKADQALYQAKRNGRNQVVVYGDDLPSAMELEESKPIKKIGS